MATGRWKSARMPWMRDPTSRAWSGSSVVSIGGADANPPSRSNTSLWNSTIGRCSQYPSLLNSSAVSIVSRGPPSKPSASMTPASNDVPERCMPSTYTPRGEHECEDGVSMGAEGNSGPPIFPRSADNEPRDCTSGFEQVLHDRRDLGLTQVELGHRGRRTAAHPGGRDEGARVAGRLRDVVRGGQP